MKPRQILSFTADTVGQQRPEEAVHAQSTVVLVARNLRDALEIISTEGDVLDRSVVSMPRTREQRSPRWWERRIPRTRHGRSLISRRNLKS
jgi:hypothetical protein